MNKFLEIARKALGCEYCNNLKILSGSTSSLVFIVDNDLYKMGSTKDLAKEMEAYQLFKRLLGEGYNNIFPDFMLFKKNKNLSLYKFKYLGEHNLEEYLFNFCFKNRGKKALIKINKSILDNLDYIYKITQRSNLREADFFFHEILRAIELNLNRGRLFNKANKEFILNLKLNKKFFLNNCSVSLIHKDLTAGNIIINKNKAYFIDPRACLPHLVSTTTHSNSGNIGIDLAGYYVTITRKELELNKTGKYSLYFIKTAVKDRIREYIKKKAFNKRFIDLCFLYWYSVYLGCSCRYCTSPERKWLYIKMKESFYFYRKRIKRTFKK